MLRISQINRLISKEALKNRKDQEIKHMAHGELEYFGHVTMSKKYVLLQLIIQGKVNGERSADRGRMCWLKNVGGWVRYSSKHNVEVPFFNSEEVREEKQEELRGCCWWWWWW